MATTLNKRTGRGAAIACIAATFVLVGCGATGSGRAVAGSSTTKSTIAPSTTTRAPATSTSSTPTTVGSAFETGKVTAIGDSVMVDYSGELSKALPGIDVEATVGEQWTTGVSLVQKLHSEGVLGTTVVIGLGTNGPVSDSAFHAMLIALAGVKRIVFVTVHVDRSWGSSVNAMLHKAATNSSQIKIADWAALAASHPDWFYSDGTHLPIGGAGATALAALVATTVNAPAS